VFVCNDSGPMHMAAALKRPIVALFGSSDSVVWHPWTDSVYRIVQTTGRSTVPIASIRPADVTAAIDEVLEASRAETL